MTQQSPSRDATETLLRRYYDAFNQGDIDGMLACVSDDIVHDVNQSERRIGRERFHAFCARMAHHYKETLDGVTIMTNTDGTRASAEFNVRGSYLQTEEGLPDATGQAYALPAGAFFAIRDGRIARVSTYYNLTEWIMQVSAG
jgi:steroid delta-isomerase-like uncharacterized protein